MMMLSHLFVYVIGLLLAIQGAKSLVTIDPNTCAAYPLTLQASLDEMVAMAQAAFDRTQNAYNLQASQQELDVVFHTFDAYFATSNAPATARDLLCMPFHPADKNIYVTN